VTSVDDGSTDRPVGRQLWRELLFLHQPVALDQVRPLVPAELAIDTFDGQAWVTLIPFWVLASRPVGVPKALGIDFLEINLRTYVRSDDGEPGIYFFSLEASSWLAVSGARLGYGLPYFPARMAARKEASGAIRYRSVRRSRGRAAALHVGWRTGPPRERAAAGSLDHFLIERYALFVRRLGRLYRTRVRHQPYPLREASVEFVRESLLARTGLPPLQVPPPLVHQSPGVDVELYRPHRVAYSGSGSSLNAARTPSLHFLLRAPK
jgi:uncharacterized protein YqjF (DUF2071 family)